MHQRPPRHRNQEVPSRISDQSLDLPLVVSLARSPEPLLERVVALQLRKCLRLLPPPVSQDLRHRQLRVVVHDGSRHSAKIGERLVVPLQERLRRLGRKSHYEAVVRLWQIDHQIVCLLLLSADHH